MPSEWTEFNISYVEERLDSCPDDLLPLVNEIVSVAREPNSEEKAVKLLDLRERFNDYKMVNGIPHINSAIGELLAVCIYKDLRDTATVQSITHDAL